MLNESLWVPREEKLSIWGAVVSTILEKFCFLWPWVITPGIARPHSPFRMSLHLSCLPQLLHHVLIITLLTINQSHLTQWAKCVYLEIPKLLEEIFRSYIQSMMICSFSVTWNSPIPGNVQPCVCAYEGYLSSPQGPSPTSISVMVPSAKNPSICCLKLNIYS